MSAVPANNNATYVIATNNGHRFIPRTSAGSQ
jgi:hypothetical protein